MGFTNVIYYFYETFYEKIKKKNYYFNTFFNFS